MPSEVYKKFYKDLDKAAKKAEEEQKKIREDENYEPKMERMPYYEDKDYEPKPAKKKKK